MGFIYISVLPMAQDSDNLGILSRKMTGRHFGCAILMMFVMFLKAAML